MLQAATAVALPVANSAVGAEESADSQVSPGTPSSASARASKLRSCVICRRRKVKCDKRVPCANCRQANIACVLPPTDHSPRWAQRLEHLSNKPAPGLDKVMDRLQNLEELVRELRGQLEREHASASPAGGSSLGVNFPESSAPNRDAEHQRRRSPTIDASNVHKQSGRLVPQEGSAKRYVSSSFWCRIEDEIDGLKMDTHSLTGDGRDSSEEEASPGKTSINQNFEQARPEYGAFLFGHSSRPAVPDLQEFHPLPSQIPFLIDVFTENVNFFIRIVHIPTITNMIRGWRGSGMTPLTPSDEALLFSIYFAAVTSMEEDDIMANFGSSKTDLSLKYRLGMEHALVKANFLDKPDLCLLQAFALFLCLARRHDSPRVIWMMTGLLVRIAQYLGIHRDGSHFDHLTPFEIEMRRRVWWVVCMLDVRASEDQGTDMSIMSTSFDTKIPMNINEVDLDLESKQIPTERHGVTDTSFARIAAGITQVMRQLMAPGTGNGVIDPEKQSRLVNEIYQKFEEEYFQYTKDSVSNASMVAVTIARLIMEKMRLIVFLPHLFSSPSQQQVSDEIRTSLLFSAIQVAEYNHVLNDEQAYRQWRWVYQTRTHWHAIVYLMIEISRRPWSPIVERAWMALHSRWLIPSRTPTDKRLRIWIPLRKLMENARIHREAELKRLRADPQAVSRLEVENRLAPLPASSGPSGTGLNNDFFHERWRQLIAIPEGAADGAQSSGVPGVGLTGSSLHNTWARHPATTFVPLVSLARSNSGLPGDVAYIDRDSQRMTDRRQRADSAGFGPPLTSDRLNTLSSQPTVVPLFNASPNELVDWSHGPHMDHGFAPWQGADGDHPADVFSNLDVDFMDTNMDLNGDVNWYDWIASAQGMEWDARPTGNTRS